jgi:hypothetical protein
MWLDEESILSPEDFREAPPDPPQFLIGVHRRLSAADSFLRLFSQPQHQEQRRG